MFHGLQSQGCLVSYEFLSPKLTPDSSRFLSLIPKWHETWKAWKQCQHYHGTPKCQEDLESVEEQKWWTVVLPGCEDRAPSVLPDLQRSLPDNGTFPRVCLLAGLWSQRLLQGMASGWRSPPGDGDLIPLNLLEFIIFETSTICQAWQNTTCKFKSVG